MSKSNFQKLYEINVNHKTESKNKLKYLSWAFAWAEFKKVNPNATYTVDQYDGKPYLYDEVLGYLVSTKITVDGEVIPMSLPVMDGANNAMKSARYSYKVKEWVNRKATGNFIDKFVEPATMFDVNKTMMRCLVKNMAMFGLGLYIYAGEDIPSVEIEFMSIKDLDFLRDGLNGNLTEVMFCGAWNINKLEDLHQASFDGAVKYITENKQ